MAISVTERGTVQQAGRRRAEKVARARRPRSTGFLLGHLVAVVVAAVAWLFLVRAAIDFGQAARGSGEVSAWLVCAAGTVGATVCLLLVFVLLARVWTRLTGANDYVPRRSSGGKRAR